MLQGQRGRPTGAGFADAVLDVGQGGGRAKQREPLRARGGAVRRNGGGARDTLMQARLVGCRLSTHHHTSPTASACLSLATPYAAGCGGTCWHDL